MNRKAIKLIKRDERVPASPTPFAAAGLNRCSAAVRYWVVEFQQLDRNESPPAFNSLFEEVLSETGRAD